MGSIPTSGNTFYCRRFNTMVKDSRDGWTKEEEEWIAKLMIEDKSTRIQAIQKMQRIKKRRAGIPLLFTQRKK